MLMIRTFRKYHRTIAIAVCLPLILTAITGIGYTIFDKWFGRGDIAGFLMRVHTFSILGLEEIYPLLTGLGLLGLLFTGLSLTNLFRKSSKLENL
jgi:hypothetical protein